MNIALEHKNTFTLNLKHDFFRFNRPAKKKIQPRAEDIIAELIEKPIIKDALARLKYELPKNLKYHCLEHTLDVLKTAIKLGSLDQLKIHDLELLGIAAAWHDIGFIYQNTDNEKIGASLVKEEMLEAGYSEIDIEDVFQAIMDTKIKFNPQLKTLYQESTGRLSPWLLDADLSNFGQKNFWQKSRQVFEEMNSEGLNSIEDMKSPKAKNYLTTTIRLIFNHSWHSRAAKVLFSEQQNLNKIKLGILLAELTDGSDQGCQKAWNKLTA